jgi:hypothetical protein
MAYRRTTSGAAATLDDLTMEQEFEFVLGPRSSRAPSAFRSDDQKLREWQRHEEVLGREFPRGPGARLPGWWWAHYGDAAGGHDPERLGLEDWSKQRLYEEAQMRGFPWDTQSILLDLLGELGDQERTALESRAAIATDAEVARWERHHSGPWKYWK